MVKRNFPLVVYALVFVMLLYFMYSIPRYTPVKKVEEESASLMLEPHEYFSGRVVIPTLDDIYVLGNTSERSLLQVVTFLQGRSAGLHFLASEHFKKVKVERRKQLRKSSRYPIELGEEDDIHLGLRLTIDSLGRFVSPYILFSNTDDEIFKEKLLRHVEYFWRLPKCKKGKLEMWIPLRFRAQY